ncbi:hypothetical protein C0Q70_11909 [Pomacea canaliculata]|uniref:Malic enzyme n=1 Tax=Pomacea canaliculata TaxID=400727 RepID=A0A2T7P7B1_POMCA|nr:hypothetical protein C0Q70_11909 [Pomacea canaliculata]
MDTHVSLQGLAFTLRERQVLGIHGLIAPALYNQDKQVYRVMQSFHRWDNDFDRYLDLIALQDRNEKLFYRVVTENVELMMPVIYTPTVGLACQKFGLVYRKPRGLYISIYDLGHVYSIFCNWPVDDVKAIVVTDGERILGLGDLGAYGMGIPVGKLSLYTALAGIHPHQCLPILLDVGTNNETLRNDPLYIGLNQKRERGKKYDQFIEEFMQAAVRRYGENVLIQFEDFGNENAFRLLEKYRQHYCTFNDDIQGTASVVLAGITASLRLTQKPLEDNLFVFLGAGEASIGIANLLTKALMKKGLSKEEGCSKIWLVDAKGLVVKDRPSGDITHEKAPFAKEYQHLVNLEQIIKTLKPTAIIGAAACPGAFTEEILKDMASFNKRPIIFALSNPTSKAECTAEQAYSFTQGRVYTPGQGNNAYIFPGVALAVTSLSIRCITEDIFLKAAESLAESVTEKDLEEGRVYPPLSSIQSVSLKIATDIATFAYKNRLALHIPEPENLEKFIRSLRYSTDYESYAPDIYEWPENAKQ